MRFISTLLIASALAAQAAANPVGQPDIASRITDYTSSYVVQEDGAFIESGHVALKILKESAISRAKQRSISYSTSIQKLEIAAAYNQKADGRRLDVPSSNFQVEINTGKEPGGPVFSDYTTTTIVFPDVQVGDTLFYEYRLAAKEPIFPKHFDAARTFSKASAYDKATIKIDVPASMWTQYRINGFTELLNEEKNGRKIVEWQWKNPDPVINKRTDYTVYNPEKEVGYSFSSFRNHLEIAALYGERALPKTAVNDRIRQLADEITSKAKNDAEATKAIYEWVALNITYAGNCIGLGAVVPRDIDFVLDNKMGDCKDHATLFQALLAAKGINSTQALINAGSIYRLPSIPVVSMVNHVINYIPSLNIFADTTSNTTPFGLLPEGLNDKPVLLVSGDREGMRTPPVGPEAVTQTMTTNIEIGKNGSAKGAVEIKLTGLPAAMARESVRKMKREDREKLVYNLYKGIGRKASGSFESEDATELTDRFRYGASFDVEGMFQYPGVGAFAVGPYFYSNVSLQGLIASTIDHDDEAEEALCSGGKVTEDYFYTIPKEMKIIALPPSVTIKSRQITYKATYKRNARKISVHRELIDNTGGGNICSRDVLAEQRDFAIKVSENLKAQILYR